MIQAPLGVILAGGQARRMGGGDKGLLDIGGQTLLSHVIERLAPQVSELVLNANGDARRFDDYGLAVVADSQTGFVGPLAGVLAGMDYAIEQNLDYVVTVAADTPFFPADLVLALCRTLDAKQDQIAIAATPDPKKGMMRHPTFGLWPINLRDDLRAALGSGVRKVVQWADPDGVSVVPFPVAEMDPFFNVNTPEDLALVRSLDLANTS